LKFQVRFRWLATAKLFIAHVNIFIFEFPTSSAANQFAPKIDKFKNVNKWK